MQLHAYVFQCVFRKNNATILLNYPIIQNQEINMHTVLLCNQETLFKFCQLSY